MRVLPEEAICSIQFSELQRCLDTSYLWRKVKIVVFCEARWQYFWLDFSVNFYQEKSDKQY